MRLSQAASIFALIVMISAVLMASRQAARAAGPGFTLTSAAFGENGTIPTKYTCSGENQSPPLKWTAVPAGARSLALIVGDPDAPNGTFFHWVFYNLPPSAGGLPAAVPSSPTAEGGEQGSNGRGDVGYTGPCPPPGAPHHYHFRLEALDRNLDLKPGAGASKVRAAAKGHVLATAQLVGIFGR